MRTKAGSLACRNLILATEVRQEAEGEGMQGLGISGATRVERLGPPVVQADHPAPRTPSESLTATAVWGNPLASLAGCYPIRS
eukprot:2479280-Pyramimonas_sp.AAC.1